MGFQKFVNDTCFSGKRKIKKKAGTGPALVVGLRVKAMVQCLNGSVNA